MKMTPRKAKMRAEKIAETMWWNMLQKGQVTTAVAPDKMTIGNVLAAFREAQNK
jgi:hypothetical protein